MNADERVKRLRAALVRIAAMPCTGRACSAVLADLCATHYAEHALIEDDWDAPLDEPGYTANKRGLGSTQ